MQIEFTPREWEFLNNQKLDKNQILKTREWMPEQRDKLFSYIDIVNDRRIIQRIYEAILWGQPWADDEWFNVFPERLHKQVKDAIACGMPWSQAVAIGRIPIAEQPAFLEYMQAYNSLSDNIVDSWLRIKENTRIALVNLLTLFTIEGEDLSDSDYAARHQAYIAVREYLWDCI